jgi:hypothetical protein
MDFKYTIITVLIYRFSTANVHTEAMLQLNIGITSFTLLLDSSRQSS